MLLVLNLKSLDVFIRRKKNGKNLMVAEFLTFLFITCYPTLWACTVIPYVQISED